MVTEWFQQVPLKSPLKFWDPPILDIKKQKKKTENLWPSNVPMAGRSPYCTNHTKDVDGDVSHWLPISHNYSQQLCNTCVNMNSTTQQFLRFDTMVLIHYAMESRLQLSDDSWPASKQTMHVKEMQPLFSPKWKLCIFPPVSDIGRQVSNESIIVVRKRSNSIYQSS